MIDNSQHRRMSITTYRGVEFFPLAPRYEDIWLEDVAHALALLCRYNGHTKQFYCMTPESRVLTHDLEWLPVGDLSVGDSLVGFDEHAPAGRRSRRKLHRALVTAHEHVKRRVVKLRLSDGTELRCSEEHPWLMCTRQSRNQVWLTAGRVADDLARGMRRYMLRFLPTWEGEPSYQAGYLAAAFDGEGHLAARPPGKGMTVGFAQNPGVMLDQVVSWLQARGFKFSLVRNPQSRAMNLIIQGGWTEQLRLLGTLRPARLLPKWTAAYGREFPSIAMLEVEAVEPEGEQWVAAMETSTNTYFAEGFGAHNSVAQHSVLVSEYAEQVAMQNFSRSPAFYMGDGRIDMENVKREALEVAKWGLLHDASEAYIGDLCSPIKPFFPQWATAEQYLEVAVARRFGLQYPMPDEVKYADKAVFYSELESGVVERADWWELPEEHPDAGLTIVPMGYARAEKEFLERFYRLFGPVDYENLSSPTGVHL